MGDATTSDAAVPSRCPEEDEEEDGGGDRCSRGPSKKSWTGLASKEVAMFMAIGFPIVAHIYIVRVTTMINVRCVGGHMQIVLCT